MTIKPSIKGYKSVIRHIKNLIFKIKLNQLIKIEPKLIYFQHNLLSLLQQYSNFLNLKYKFIYTFIRIIINTYSINMKALILVGGYGTRMRPLTISIPKSVIPFINRPMVEHQIQALAKIGVDQVILAINYQSEIIKADLEFLTQKYKIKITYSKQEEALGTAGPLRLAQKIIKSDTSTDIFFVFNSDVLCDYPLQKLLAFHKNHNKMASIVLATVKDPSRFGVVVTDTQQRITKFVQKPKQFISNKINAGMYILNKTVIDRIPQRFCMIQKQIFPQLAQQGELYAYSLQNNFWYDIGKPSDYLEGQGSYLKFYNIKSQRAQTKDNVLVDASTQIGQNCVIGPNVVIGPRCKIGKGCRLKNCTLMGDTKVGDGVFIQNSIISWRCKLGNWSRVQGLSVLAQQVAVKQQIRVTQCMVLSYKGINQNVQKEILM